MKKVTSDPTISARRSSVGGLRLGAASIAAAFAFCLSGGNVYAQAQTGGPDAGGYSWIDNRAPGGPAFVFDSVVDNPGHGYFALEDDDDVHVVLPFPVFAYGVLSTDIQLSNNGSFLIGANLDPLPDTNGNGGHWTWTNSPLTVGPNPASPAGFSPNWNFPCISPYWDDFIIRPVGSGFDGGDGVYLETRGTAPNRQFVIQWNQMDLFGTSPSTATVQCIMYENSNDMLFLYPDTDYGNGGSFGATATVGLRGTLPGQVLQYSFDTPGSIPNGRAIRIVGPLRQADCNANGVGDLDDIANGTSTDCNLDEVPDECADTLEVVEFRSGNGPFSNGDPDDAVRFLAGPADGPFGAQFTPADFANVTTPAIQISPLPTYLPSTTGSLPADGQARWVTTAPAGSTALYSVDFEIASDRIPAASLLLNYAADSQVGSAGIPAVYLNGIKIECTVQPGGIANPTNLRCNTVAPLLVPGTNTFSIYNNDANAGASAVIFAGTIIIQDPPLDVQTVPVVVEIDEFGVGTLNPDDALGNTPSDCGPVFGVSASPNSFDCSDIGNTFVSLITAQNTAGNQGSANADVTVVDLLGPVFTNCPASPFVRNCNHPNGYLFIPEYTDNCEAAGYEIVANGALLEDDPPVLPFGFDYPVEITAYDVYGNATVCAFNATILPDVLDPLRPISIAAEDGTVTQTDEPNLIEGTASPKDGTFLVGDQVNNLGARGILSFNLAELPEEAIIVGARIRITRKQGYGNTTTFGNLLLDMGSPSLGGTPSLNYFDYDTTDTDYLDVATSFPYPAGNGYTTFAELSSDYYENLSVLAGSAENLQFRVRFETEGDFDNALDAIAFASGNSRTAIEVPELIIEYYLEECFSFQTFPEPSPIVNQVTVFSIAAHDGNMTESHFTSEVGGNGSYNSSTFPVGDTATRQQQVGLLSFDTSAIPVGSTITSAELRLFCTSIVSFPSSLGALNIDMRNPYIFPTSYRYGAQDVVEASDFQAWSHFPAVGQITLPARNQFTAWTPLDAKGLLAINRGGITQMKLRFTNPDDGDLLTDSIAFAASDYGATSSGRPTLRITYQEPDSIGSIQIEVLGSDQDTSSIR
jgi:hypothetical protein